MGQVLGVSDKTRGRGHKKGCKVWVTFSKHTNLAGGSLTQKGVLIFRHFIRPIYSNPSWYLVLTSQVEWSTGPAGSSLGCFFNRSSSEGSDSSENCLI